MTNPKERPGMKLWESALHTAERFTLVCPNCHGSYYHRNSICPWCKSNRPSFLIGAVDYHVIYFDSEANHYRTNINKNESGFCVQYHQICHKPRLLGFRCKPENENEIESTKSSCYNRNLMTKKLGVHKIGIRNGFDTGKKKINHISDK
jgi:hypothetical protein